MLGWLGTDSGLCGALGGAIWAQQVPIGTLWHRRRSELRDALEPIHVGVAASPVDPRTAEKVRRNSRRVSARAADDDSIRSVRVSSVDAVV